ncbi:glycine C-acetyltransferase [Myxococcota bacterium]|nr:glycine C-acetyltransferase [Myxococcota bacterium]MBU1379502.1 glycine C-acetyltransferase [Myxococcota bacterium]MBU1495733.1 glycine C-acetyltransferase [Myxococcota bacterium]
MYGNFKEILETELKNIRDAGLFKSERIVVTPQSSLIKVAGRSEPVINMCANNYLGLANDPRLVDSAKAALDKYAFGMSSVRFIVGTLDLHKELEAKLAAFIGKEDVILYSSCFDANGGLFETLLTEQDAIISDTLNHASIIDGVRLCKAKRFRYINNDMEDLEKQLIEADAQGLRLKMIATDGVFSMDGIIANLAGVCDLADKYNAIVMVDDSHATGFIGKTGRGSHEYNNVIDRVDIVTSTLGKAMGGASGGFTASHKAVIDILRQRSRPYLFSNTLAPVIAATTLKVLEIVQESTELIDKLAGNMKFFREEMSRLGFNLAGKDHAIIPVMLGDARLASMIADDLLDEGVYAIGFSYPVVPKEKARIRTQISAMHSMEQLEKAVAAFEKVGRKHGVID